MTVANMLAKSSTGVQEIERRIHVAIPAWKEWTRQLKQVYILLPVFGSSNDGIEEMCDEFDWNKDKLFKKIDNTESFKERLDEYRKIQRYPIFPNQKKNRITKAHLDTVYAHESAVLSFMHLERAKAQGTAGVNFALKMMANGYLEYMEPINRRPEIKHYLDGSTQPGIVVNGDSPQIDYSADGLPSLNE
tara:strand:- start:234 stop:803 length:570 start_codon:yes stop_codon:yes gene_type:complete